MDVPHVQEIIHIFPSAPVLYKEVRVLNVLGARENDNALAGRFENIRQRHEAARFSPACSDIFATSALNAAAQKDTNRHSIEVCPAAEKYTRAAGRPTEFQRRRSEKKTRSPRSR